MTTNRRPSTFSNRVIHSSTSLTTLSTSERDGLKRFLSGGRRSQGLIDSAELFGKVKVLANIRNSDTCLSTAFSPDGKFYAVALANGLVNVYNSRNDNLIYILNKSKSVNIHCTNTTSTCVRFKSFEDNTRNLPEQIAHDENKPDHLPLPRLIPSHLTRRRSSFRNESLDLFAKVEGSKHDYLLSATFADGMVKTFRFLTDECVQEIDEGRETLSLDYDSQGKFFVTSGGDGNLNVYDAETGQRSFCYKPPFNEKAEFQRIYSITFHPKNVTEFLTGGLDGKVRFYDTRLPKLHKEIHGQFITGEGIAFHPSGNEFCTASWQYQNTLQIYDYRSSKRLQSFDNSGNGPATLPSSMLYSAKYYQDGKHIVVGGTESISVMERSSGKAIAGIKGLGRSVYSLDVNESKVGMVTGKEVALLDFFV